jgi:23S rRNA (uracil1939-C5)-methyltransferase
MQINIEKLVYGGDGLGRLPADEHGAGKAVFVPFVIDGETVEVDVTQRKKGFARGELKSVVQASARRVAAPCPYFQHCGGCHYQHMDYAHQLENKAAILKETLRRAARIELDCELQIHASPEWNYRNRTRLKLQTAPEFALGYYKFASHDLLPIEECLIISPLINQAIRAVWQAGREGKLASGVEEIEIFANAEDTHLLLELYLAPTLPRKNARELIDIVQSIMPEIAGLVAFTSPRKSDQDLVPQRIAAVGAEHIIYRTKTGEYRVSAGSFFQVNRHMIDSLAELVTDGVSGKLALDLYAGAGLFSTILARNFAQVIAVESSPTSHADLTYNSPANVKALKVTTEQYLKDSNRNAKPDLVVVDPPRGGLGENSVRAIGAIQASHLIYVSCDPATLGRDLVGLLAAGYRIEQAHMIDMFPQTYHVESVFHLIR